ncbi:MAG TPA: xanthine dehydrogenase molybdopterin binding subunit, partial [Xanthomonadales bacterium]|nr:xanthine dehydrogenase molybdopterin binding subunit [Xanthomonadales bacterium]
MAKPSHTPMVRSPVAHDSAVKHVTGSAVYVDDILEPAGLLHAYVGVSRVASGKVRSMDLSKVRAAKDVIAVITADDVPGQNDTSPMHTMDEPILASKEVKFCGQVLFAVAATDRNAARWAARLVEFEIDESESIIEIEDAVERESWVTEPHEMSRGDVAEGLARSACRLQGEVETGGQDHFYLEGQASMA